MMMPLKYAGCEMPSVLSTSAVLSNQVFWLMAANTPITMPMIAAKIMAKMASINVLKIFSPIISLTFLRLWKERPR